MNGVKAFFDTNILLYMYSGTDEPKRARAKELFGTAALNERALLSVQVIQEFYAAAGGAEIVYTEDLNHPLHNHGQRYGTVEVRNPFRDADGTTRHSS